MGFFSKLFGIGQSGKPETYEERLAHTTQAAGIGAVENSQPRVASVSEELGAAQEDRSARDAFHDGAGRKVIPEIECERVEPHLSAEGSHMELWVTLCNKSPFEIEVTDVELLREHNRPGEFLKPGEKYEARIYQGDTPKDDTLDDVIIRYKIVGNGDYFESRNYIEYDFRDGYYVPREIHQNRSVQDI